MNRWTWLPTSCQSYLYRLSPELSPDTGKMQAIVEKGPVTVPTKKGVLRQTAARRPTGARW